MPTERDEALTLLHRPIPPYPEGFAGRGIVIPGGGKYFPCAWVCLQMLRELGCSLPIECWYLGDGEMSAEMCRLVEPLDVRCVDALEVRLRSPARILNGWELKPYAIVHSRFEEVLMLDADVVPIVDPSFLFEEPAYRKCGAIFWPDDERFGPEHVIWRLSGIQYRDEPQVESGQILVNKRRSWEALVLTMRMNEHSDFWYRHIYGDKDTFHIGWRKAGSDYAMPSRGIHHLPLVNCHHDFTGRRVFQHRNFAKWTLEKDNPTIPDFVYEDRCLYHLNVLRNVWLSRA